MEAMAAVTEAMVATVATLATEGILGIKAELERGVASEGGVVQAKEVADRVKEGEARAADRVAAARRPA